MLKNIDQGDLRGHGRRKDFSGRGTKGFFENFSWGEKVADLFFPTQS